MSGQVKNGRQPLSARSTFSQTSSEDVFGNPLALSDELKAELKAEGLVGRWVNAKTLYDMQGYHAKGWRAYKRKASATMGSTDFATGKDPEGIVRRGDCILAVKTMEEVAKHKSFLKTKADRYKTFNKQRAAELRQHAQDQGIKTQISEDHEFGDDDADENE